MFRSVKGKNPNRAAILSGEGSYRNGGRWNAPGSVRAVYASLKPEVATAEALAYYRYYGFPDEDAMPRTAVALEFDLKKVLDLTKPAVRRKLKVTLVEITAEDWRKVQDAGHESLTQAIGRAVCAAGCEAMIVPSAQVRQGVNIVLFPGNKAGTSLARVYTKTG